jgi:flagellar hook-associated protein 2
MSTTVAASSNSGAIDVPTLVSQLMTVANQPVVALQNKISSDQAQISAWGTISGLVSSFQTSVQSLNDSVISNSATPSDPSIFSASAISTAVPGNYSLSVAQLAQAQTLVAAGQISTSAAIGNVGDTLTINVGTTTPNNTFSASTTSGSTTVTVASIANLAVGAPISGAGIPAGATIASIDTTSGTSFTISAPATATGSGVTLQGGAAATFTKNSSTSITINSGNNSLQGISDAINAANMGVSATIVNDGSSTPYRLVLTSTNTGSSNSLQITTTGSAALNTLLAYDPATTENMTQTVAAQNANLTVNGIPITSASNTVANAIQGVTLTLNNKTTTPATLTVAYNTAAISTAVSGFVSAYNALSSQLTSDFAYGNANAGVPAGVLAGDGTISAMQQQLQNIFDTAATPVSGGTLKYLAQIGIGFQADGTLAVNSTTLNSAITSNFSDFSNLISSTAGFGTTGLGAWCANTFGPGGLIGTATQSLNTTITGLYSNISTMQSQNAQLQATYITEYSNLNMLLSSLNNTSSYLTSQLSALSK